MWECKQRLCVGSKVQHSASGFLSLFVLMGGEAHTCKGGMVQRSVSWGRFTLQSPPRVRCIERVM